MRQQAFLLSALSFCPLFNLQTCFQTPDVNCRNMSQINTHSKSPRSSFLEFGSTVLSLITESVWANAGEDCWCHTFAAIKTAATKWPVTLSVSHIVWNLQIIALNASASVSGLWAEPENHYCTFDISKKYIFFLYHFVRQVLLHFLFQYCDLHTERVLVHYSHSQMHLVLTHYESSMSITACENETFIAADCLWTTSRHISGVSFPLTEETETFQHSVWRS